MLKIILKVLLILIFPSISAADSTPNSLFITVLNKQPAISTKKQISTLVEYAKKSNINVLFVQVYRANRSWFPSRIADDSPYQQIFNKMAEDPLAYLISQAHASGIEVHAWVNLLSLSQNQQAFILKRHGLGVLTRNLTPKKTIEDYKIDNQYFLEPSDPHVKQDLSLIIQELLKRYPTLDGLQFDYIRYPDVHPSYGYSPRNVANFKKQKHQQEIVDGSPIWQQWKRDQVTNLLAGLIKVAKRINPRIHISTTGCVSYTRALFEAFQDWPAWLNSNLVEFVTMMNYPEDNQIYIKNIQEFRNHVNDFSKVNITVGAYKFIKTPDIFKEQYNLCLNEKARSCVIFHYDSLIDSPVMGDFLSQDSK